MTEKEQKDTTSTDVETTEAEAPHDVETGSTEANKDAEATHEEVSSQIILADKNETPSNKLFLAEDMPLAIDEVNVKPEKNAVNKKIAKSGAVSSIPTERKSNTSIKPKKNPWIITSLILAGILLVGTLGSAAYVLSINHNATTIYEQAEKDLKQKKKDIKHIDELTQKLAELEADNAQLRSTIASRRGFI